VRGTSIAIVFKLERRNTVHSQLLRDNSSLGCSARCDVRGVAEANKDTHAVDQSISMTRRYYLLR
jgi:hypothetical protein